MIFKRGIGILLMGFTTLLIEASSVIPPSPATLHQVEKSIKLSQKAQKILKAVTGRSNPIEILKSGDLDTETLPMSIILQDNQKREKATPAVVSNKAKELYLTFDDGPLRGTKNVLNVLEKEQIKATMFCIASHARRRKSLFARESAMPNLLIANHTYSHANGHYRRFYSHTLALLKDIEHAQLLLGGRKYLRLAGRNVWRLPKIKRNDGAIIALRGRKEVPRYDALAKEGYYIYGWDVEWHFNHRSHKLIENAQKLADHIESLYRHGRLAKHGKAVLLTHDFMFRTKGAVAELEKFIHIMRVRGWKFKTINHYTKSEPKQLYVAKYYKKKCQCIASKKKAIQKNIIAMKSFNKVAYTPTLASLYKISSKIHTYKALNIVKKKENDELLSSKESSSLPSVVEHREDRISLSYTSLASYLKTSQIDPALSQKSTKEKVFFTLLSSSIQGMKRP